MSQWHRRASAFLETLKDPAEAGSRSVPGGPVTLYGTCYSALGSFYMGVDNPLDERACAFIQNCQDPESGLLVGPELKAFEPSGSVLHDREHLLWHSTCAALPTCLHFGIPLKHPITAAHRFCDLRFLREWLDRRDLRNAWFEGNNILFVGQLLVYLRDVEHLSGADAALEVWFAWLDETIDPKTGLWGTNGHCSALQAVCGGYHQLLVYYHEERELVNPLGTVDTVLSLQHVDGGFNPAGDGGACEDVDAVDILVNFYKRFDTRRAVIRSALRRCLGHILDLQNADGGFPYNRLQSQNHMGIPGTYAKPRQSTAFATWFRIHTLALMAEVLTDEPELQAPFRFTRHLSMGWHSSTAHQPLQLTRQDRMAERPSERDWQIRQARHAVYRASMPLRRVAATTRRYSGSLYRRLLGNQFHRGA